MMELLIQKELMKLLNAQNSFKVKYSTWVSNLVPLRKKFGEISLFVYFHNLNRASDKDSYLVPSKEQILQTVSGFEMLSLLDGFFG